jgi:hypothetical protein
MLMISLGMVLLLSFDHELLKIDYEPLPPAALHATQGRRAMLASYDSKLCCLLSLRSLLWVQLP